MSESPRTSPAPTLTTSEQNKKRPRKKATDLYLNLNDESPEAKGYVVILGSNFY